jgi:N-acyl-D-amino-acid deacylase
VRQRVVALVCLLFVSLAATSAHGQTFDLVLRQGRVLDGTGAPERVADVGVREGRIAAIGDLRNARARRVVDASGLIVAPGFIDMHSHADRALSSPGLNVALNNLTQGITTVVVGQDGRQAWPVGGSIRQTIDDWRARGLALNAILLVGGGTVRQEVLGNAPRAPTPEELERMKARVRAAMDGGAWGISTGLGYTPGRFSTTDEVIALTEVVQPYGGVYISHLRDQGDKLLDSVEETIRIGRATGVTVVATHFKSAGHTNFGKARAAMQRIAEAREEGVPIWVDVYPWATSSDGIDVEILPDAAYELAPPDPDAAAARRALAAAVASLGTDDLVAIVRADGSGLAPNADWLRSLPREALVEMAHAAVARWTREDRRLALRHALEDGRLRDSVRALVRRALEQWPPNLHVIERAPDPRLEGLNLAQAADVLGLDIVDAAIAIDLMDAQVTRYHMSEQDVEEILRWPFTAICTDGTVPYFGVGIPHPRSYGTFPRLLRHYAMERKVLTLPDAIHRATGLAARILGLRDRGLLREGMAADIVVFDPQKIAACATYARPHCYSTGIEYLLVNGTLTLDRGRYTGALAGKILTPKGAIPTGPDRAAGG